MCDCSECECDAPGDAVSPKLEEPRFFEPHPNEVLLDMVPGGRLWRGAPWRPITVPNTMRWASELDCEEQDASTAILLIGDDHGAGLLGLANVVATRLGLEGDPLDLVATGLRTLHHVLALCSWWYVDDGHRRSLIYEAMTRPWTVSRLQPSLVDREVVLAAAAYLSLTDELAALCSIKAVGADRVLRWKFHGSAEAVAAGGDEPMPFWELTWLGDRSEGSGAGRSRLMFVSNPTTILDPLYATTEMVVVPELAKATAPEDWRLALVLTRDFLRRRAEQQRRDRRLGLIGLM